MSRWPRWRILLNQVEQDAFERRGFGPIPARTRFAHLRKVMVLNDGSTAHGLRPQRARQRVECLLGTDEPTVTTIVAPRIRDPVTLETPFEPPQFDESEVLEQFYRSPPRGHSTLSQLALG